MARNRVRALIDIDFDFLIRMNEKDLRTNLQRINKVANQRIKSLREKAPNSPALQSLDKSGRVKFSTKGMTRNEMLKEFSQARNFMQMKTSTLRGFKNYEKNVKKSVRETLGENLSDKQMKTVLEALDILRNDDESGVNSINYREYMEYMTELVKKPHGFRNAKNLAKRTKRDSNSIDEYGNEANLIYLRNAEREIERNNEIEKEYKSIYGGNPWR